MTTEKKAIKTTKLEKHEAWIHSVEELYPGFKEAFYGKKTYPKRNKLNKFATKIAKIG